MKIVQSDAIEIQKDIMKIMTLVAMILIQLLIVILLTNLKKDFWHYINIEEGTAEEEPCLVVLLSITLITCNFFFKLKHRFIIENLLKNICIISD